MRYYYEKPQYYNAHYGTLYLCNHPLYDRCTLFTINNKGLAVIQQRFEPNSKHTFWTEIDPWLCDTLYLNENFLDYFMKHGGISDDNGLYPTVTIRQIMHALKIKPLHKDIWETVFDRKIL